MATATQLELSYLAGIFDGEGCIGITCLNRKHRPSKMYRMYCKLGMCNPYIPKLLHFRYGGCFRTYHPKDYVPAQVQKQQVWDWAISGAKALGFLYDIQPYLRIKKSEAELAIQFQERMNCHSFQGNKVPDEEIAYREAQKILMSKLKFKSMEV